MSDGFESNISSSLNHFLSHQDVTNNRIEEQREGEESEQNKEPFREQDIYLPIANVARIMKQAIPQNGKIAKDAKECAQECVSEFISFITSEASERCAQEKRKTINGEDVLFAMATLGFEPYVEPLKLYLLKYRESLKSEKPPEQLEKEAYPQALNITQQEMNAGASIYTSNTFT